VFDAAAIKAGVAGLSPHELRHTCASLAIRSRASIKTVEGLLGHKTATMTLDNYGHLYPDELDQVARSRWVQRVCTGCQQTGYLPAHRRLLGG
jgi:integrase